MERVVVKYMFHMQKIVGIWSYGFQLLELGTPQRNLRSHFQTEKII